MERLSDGVPIEATDDEITARNPKGETLRIEARVIARLGNLVQAQGSVTVGERLVAQADVTLAGEPCVSTR